MSSIEAAVAHNRKVLFQSAPGTLTQRIVNFITSEHRDPTHPLQSLMRLPPFGRVSSVDLGDEMTF